MRNQELQHYLNMQADRIEAVCRENGLAVAVSGGQVGPRLAVFDLRVGGSAANLVDRLRKLEEVLALRLEQSQVQVRRAGGRLVLLTPTGGLRPVWLESFDRHLKPQTLFLGVRADAPGEVLAVRPAHPDVVHILVTGSTGSGKSVLLRTMLLSLAQATPSDQAHLVLLDPKGCEFTGLERLPHVVELVRGDTNAAAVLAGLTGEMDRRGRAGIVLPRLYVFIDELADLLDQGGAAVMGPLVRLAQAGRGVGIHLIAGTQKPTNQSIGGLIKFNFKTRIVGVVPSANDAVAASGAAGSGAEKLLGQGDFMLFGPVPEPVRFQAAAVRDVAARVERLVAVKPAGAAALPRQWVYEDQRKTSVVRKLLSFPTGLGKAGRGGHNTETFTPEQIADAQSGLSAYFLRKKYPDLSGSRASRLERDYGPERTTAK
ncbi:MAG: hypothetical protein FOGNACKC_06268 [Anaerolineae bacterium]|nr:hypothetical protein [Anaerolineae bacterium]